MATSTKKSGGKANTSHTIELPRDENGEVNWNTLGNLMTRHLLDEVSAVSSIDVKYGHPMSGAVGGDPIDWRFSHEKDGIVVFRKHLKSSPLTCFLGRGVIDAPIREVAAFIKKIENNLTWNKFLVDAKYVKTISESETHADYIGYQRFELSRCFSLSIQRDVLFYVRTTFTPDGKYVHAGLSVEDPDYPPLPGIPRVELYLGTGFVMEPYNGSATRTLVDYFGHADMKGLPAFIMNRVMKRHPLALRFIRQHFFQPEVLSRDHDSLTENSPGSSPLPSDYAISHWSSASYEESVPVGQFLRHRQDSTKQLSDPDSDANDHNP